MASLLRLSLRDPGAYSRVPRTSARWCRSANLGKGPFCRL